MERREAQERTSRALAQASASFPRVDILAPRKGPCNVSETHPGYWFCETHRMRAVVEGPAGVCDGRFEAWAPDERLWNPETGSYSLSS